MNVGTLVHGSGYQAPELRPDQRPVMPDERVLTDAINRGASFTIAFAKHDTRCACEFDERNQHEVQQRCNPEGARWMLSITYPQGGGLSRHICGNHAAKTSARVGLPFPPVK